MLIDQIRISGGVAQASLLPRSDFRCFWSILTSEGYCFHVWSIDGPGRTCTLKPHMPVCKVCFPLENHLFCVTCPFSIISFLHFGAQTFKDIIKLWDFFFKSLLHDISHNYTACLFVGPFSNTKWNVALNSIILKYETIFCEKWSQGIHLGTQQTLNWVQKFFVEFGNG